MNSPIQRRLNRNTSDRYGRDINSGVFEANGETLKISQSGVLIDGQHRLKSVVATGKPIQAVIVVGIPDSAFKTIDTGRRRTFQDMLQASSYSYPKELAGLTRLLWRYRTCTLTAGSQHASNKELDYILKRDEAGLVGALKAVAWCKEKMTLPMSPTSFCYYIFKTESRNSERVDEFFKLLHLQFSGDGSGSEAIKSLWRKVMAIREEKMTIQSYVYVSFILLSWNSWVNGMPVKGKMEYKPEILHQDSATNRFVSMS